MRFDRLDTEPEPEPRSGEMADVQMMEDWSGGRGAGEGGIKSRAKRRGRPALGA